MKTSSLDSKNQNILKYFGNARDPQSIFQKIMLYGKGLSSLEKEHHTDENRVMGCQSLMYLKAHEIDGKIYFKAWSEALISAGLAKLLIDIYSGESPLTILKCPPAFVKELGLESKLTPGRSNGLSSLYLKMKQEALKQLQNNPQLLAEQMQKASS